MGSYEDRDTAGAASWFRRLLFELCWEKVLRRGKEMSQELHPEPLPHAPRTAGFCLPCLVLHVLLGTRHHFWPWQSGKSKEGKERVL